MAEPPIEEPKRKYRRFDPPAGRSPAALAKNPLNVYRKLAKKLGGAVALANFLQCSRATAYNLMIGRRRWSPRYVQRATSAMNVTHMVPVPTAARAKVGKMRHDSRPRKTHILQLDCDGAIMVRGDLMWPLVGDGQFVLYKDIQPAKVRPGDIILARLRTGEILLRAWYPVPGNDQEVYLVSLFRGPELFRNKLFRTYPIADLNDLRRVVGIWMG